MLLYLIAIVLLMHGVGHIRQCHWRAAGGCRRPRCAAAILGRSTDSRALRRQKEEPDL
jgi:hypothetical protein